MAPTDPRPRVRGRGALLGSVAGLVGVVVASTLPWLDPEFRLSAPTRWAMGVAGAAVLAVAAHARADRRWTGIRSVPTLGVALGVAMLAYPVLMSVAAAGLGGPGTELAAAAFHVVPLTLVQLIPVLAASRVSGRRHRRWETAVIATAGVSAVATGLGLLVLPQVTALLVVGQLTWFGGFVLAPAGAWSAVRGAAGEARRRAVVAGLAAPLPPAVIGWCLLVAALGTSLGWSDDSAVTGLLLGYSVGCAAAAGLAMVAVGPSASGLLTVRAVVAALHTLLAVLAVIVGLAVALMATSLDLPAPAALAVGAGATALVALPWMSLQAWIRRVVDPAREFADAIAADGNGPDEARAAVALQVLRDIVQDPTLALCWRVDDETWVDTDLEPVPALGFVDPVDLARDGDGRATVRAHPGTAAVRSRLTALGDCSAVLRPALLQIRVARELIRADAAAERERERLRQDLHDGLQGRLLGLALHLQLSGAELDDPTARLLVAETVGSLRDLVHDVRALGGGSLPEVLVHGGLPAALPVLLDPVAALVDLRLTPQRFEASLEATAYFIVGEAVSNALKHAAAARIQVDVTGPDPGPDGRRLSVVVRDDGRGGADPRLGTGLRRLAERVAGHGGVLLVRDNEAGGTVVEAVLPCGS
ncbi:hypothetical protein FDO65_17115 [Nakamurella flava]|uniref:histidine kinase n=1 Tax=Nakamurella flava TaxID=2576308 RepID=A0A4U6QCV5_9ACTN|nr:ATP-binding protein [Nakamurella flava]TKV57848.1 hypothetical protein FDO65_17115 [Nakamurella flava]